MSPEWSKLVSAPNIPDDKADVVVFEAFHIEANGRDGGHNFPELEIVKDCGLASVRMSY